MAVDEDALAHLVEARHVLQDDEDEVIRRARKILPEPVERGHSMRLELLWVVGEADVRVDAICAQGVLTWLLKVDYYSDVQPRVKKKLDGPMMRF